MSNNILRVKKDGEYVPIDVNAENVLLKNQNGEYTGENLEDLLGEYHNLEQNYTPRLNMLEANDQNITAQLAQTATKEEALTTSGSIAVDFHPLANNPVLTRHDVTDRDAQGVADPFIVFDKDSGLYHMFFEIITSTNEEIGHAYSVNGFEWTYTQVVISEGSQHFAYPMVLKHDGEWYMIPDKGNKLDVYKATNFPYEWTNIKTILNKASSDATIWKWHDGNWYMHVREGLVVNLYYTDDWLNGKWTIHPMSPIIDASPQTASTIGARGGGKAIVYDNLILLPIQGYFSTYGEYTKWYTISELSPTTVKIAEGEIIQTGDKKFGWNDRGMHHLDHIQNGDLNLFVADSIGDNSIPNNWSICMMTSGIERKRISQVKTGNTTSLTANTWTKPHNLGVSGQLLFDSDWLWNRTEGVYEIKREGYYRIGFSITFYGSAELRNIRARVINPNNNKIHLTSYAVVPSGGTANWYQTLNNNRIVYLHKGDKLTLEAFANVSTAGLLPNDEGIWFEIEKMK